MHRRAEVVYSGQWLPIAGSETTARMVYDFLVSEEGWGADRSAVTDASAVFSYHNAITRTIGVRMDEFLRSPLAIAALEHEVICDRPRLCSRNSSNRCRTFARTARPARAWTLVRSLHTVCCRTSVSTAMTCTRGRVLLSERPTCSCCAHSGARTRGSGAWVTEEKTGRLFKLGRPRPTGSSYLGLVYVKAAVCASLLLASAGTDNHAAAATDWLNALPREDDRRLTDTFGASICFASARVAAARLFELHGRHEGALRFARAEIADELVHNGPSRIHAGLVLGRCHAKLGRHSLSVAAFESASSLAEEGRYLLSSVMTARARAVAGREGAARQADQQQAGTGRAAGSGGWPRRWGRWWGAGRRGRERASLGAALLPSP